MKPNNDLRAAVLGAIFFNALFALQFLINSAKKLQLLEVVLIIALNLLFYFLYKVSQNKSTEMEQILNLESDLGLKAQNGINSPGILKCLVCAKRTISRGNVIRKPQTCGECGALVKFSGSKKEINITIFLLLAGFFGIFYLTVIFYFSRTLLFLFGIIWVVIVISLPLKMEVINKPSPKTKNQGALDE